MSELVRCHLCGKKKDRNEINVGIVPDILKNDEPIWIRICDECWKEHHLERVEDKR